MIKILCGILIFVSSGLNARHYVQVQYRNTRAITHQRVQLHYFGCVRDGCKAHLPRSYNRYYTRSGPRFRR